MRSRPIPSAPKRRASRSSKDPGNAPVLFKDLVIANASVESGDLIALNKSDGSEVWRQSGIKAAWNTPVIYRALNGADELAVLGDTGVEIDLPLLDELHDRSADPDLLGLRRDPGRGGDGVAADGFSGPDRVEAEAHAAAILGMDIKGHTVHKVWVEKASDIAAEYYASFTLDRGAKQHLAMVSARGGVDIEAVAAESTPEQRRTWAQAVWHAAHETERLGATASAAFHAFRPEMLTQLAAPQPPVSGDFATA